MEQSRVLAVEMRGLATDHCHQHHLAASLAMAFHLGLPIHMDGEHMLAEGRRLAIQGSADSPASAQIPEAFREVIEGLDMHSWGDSANDGSQKQGYQPRRHIAGEWSDDQCQ